MKSKVTLFKNFHVVSIWFVLCFFVPNQLLAQAKITLVSTKSIGEKTSIKFVPDDNSIVLGGLSDDFEPLENGFRLYTITNPTITLQGNIEQFYGIMARATSVTVDNCPNLQILDVRQNNLTQINIINSPNIVSLACDENELNQLNLTGLSKLNEVTCSWNKLEAMTIPAGCLLKKINAFGNNLEQVTLSNLPLLEEAILSINTLTKIIVDNCPALISLNLQDNALSEGSFIDIANSIPNRIGKDNGVIGAYCGNASDEDGTLIPDKNVCSTEAVKIANSKNWRVVEFDGKNWVDYGGKPSTNIIPLQQPCPKVYFNPFTQVLHITNALSNAEVRVYNVSGECVAQSLLGDSGQGILSFSFIPRGQYFVSVAGFVSSITK